MQAQSDRSTLPANERMSHGDHSYASQQRQSLAEIAIGLRCGTLGKPIMSADYRCPHCYARVDTDPDPGGGERQEYIEDCPVCCHPNRIRATLLPDEDSYAVEVSPET
ncbi:MAG: CPXCG motif-containing cysteine-rich protein [Polyangiaceae bacterium]